MPYAALIGQDVYQRAMELAPTSNLIITVFTGGTVSDTCTT
jgi:hypothetical protein